MFKYRLWVFVLLVCAFFVSARAEVYTVETVPSPKAKGQEFYVSNPDTVLSFDTEQRINALCDSLNHNTEVELAVVAVSEIDADRYTAYEFALDLFNYWGIGSSDKNTGVLLFLCSGSREVQIITGDGIAGILTDAECGSILDNNLYYLSEDDYDRGILGVCKDIEEDLMRDENRAELLLGWSPESTDGSDILTVWFIIGFLLLALMGWYGYKRLQGKPGQTKRDIQNHSLGAQGMTGCLMLIFPIPMVFFFIYYLITRRLVKSIPPVCKQCGKEMKLLDKDDPKRGLTDDQKKEEEIKAREYEVWQCPECGEMLTNRMKGDKFSEFDKCPECAAYAVKVKSKKTIKRANFFRDGLREDTAVCLCCGHQTIRKVILDKERHSILRQLLTSSGSGGSGGSGSWGGGRSSGGGAGRSF